jgi:hypothetical protein
MHALYMYLHGPCKLKKPALAEAGIEHATNALLE